MKTLSLILILSFSIPLTGIAQVVHEITWENLIPKGLDFEDPFLELNDDQLYNLRLVYKTKLLLEKKPDLVSDKAKAKNDSLETTLKNQGVDVDFLISQKDDIRDKRAKKAQSVVDSLDNKNIKMAGFLLPLDLTKKEAQEFLFVPYVGACIHMPPPPKNQILYLNYPQGFRVTEKFTPVWVEGIIRVEDFTKELFLVDGKDEINSGYALNATSIERYELE